MSEIDYTSVTRYWENVKPSILGPYMMGGFGLPTSAGEFRFRAEAEIVRRLLCDIDHDGSVLDFGSGVGYWAEEFARSFCQVDAVEGSNVIYPSLHERCAPIPNVRTYTQRCPVVYDS